MAFGFNGGIHPDDRKSDTKHKPIEILPPPDKVIIPLSMHIGAPCEALVRPEQGVFMGQLIADSNSPVSAPIHSSVSGKVLAIEPRPHPNGTKVMSIIIQNDGQDKIIDSISAYGSCESLTPENLVKIIRDAGIVGLGGATFPTHTKIKSCIGKLDTLIINGAECEPYITSDHRLMLEYPEEVVGGIKVLMKALGVSKAVLAIESNKKDAIDAIRWTLPTKGDIKIKVLQTCYPQGAEKQLIRTITGREIAPGQLPSAVKCGVFNVATTAAIHRAVTSGMPIISRFVTVAGSAISNPKTLQVRIGTPFEALINATGGFKDAPAKIIAGGPMMGTAQHNIEAPVIKGTSSLLAFTKADVLEITDQTCIRCGKCVGVCPMRLQPVYMYMYERKNQLDMLEKYHLTDCIECGSCSFICPARIHLVHSFRTGKQKLVDSKKKTGG